MVEQRGFLNWWALNFLKKNENFVSHFCLASEPNFDHLSCRLNFFNKIGSRDVEM